MTVKNKTGASAVFATTAIEGTRASQKHVLLISSIKRDGKLVNFDGFSVTATVNLRGDSRSCSYIVSGISVIKKNGQTYHALFSNDNVSPKDRRDSLRVPLDEPANIKIGDRAPLTVRTKDISISGIAFLIPGSVTVKEEEPIEATFPCSAMGSTYQIAATVARMEKQPDGRMLIGCRLSSFNKSIVALVTFLARKHGQTMPL